VGLVPPPKPLLVYDGDCGFCTKSARWLARRLPEPAVARPGQALDLAELGLTDADVAAAAWWIEADGTRRRGHAAIGRALAAGGGLWGVVGRVLLVPPVSSLARPVSALVARNRSKMPGGSDACDLPAPRP
jgi:predicted DCC family thiol-disulfide oxidoreductase YuxK